MPSLSAVTRIEQVIETLRQEYSLRATPLSAQQMHVSLVGLGEYADLPQDLLDSVVGGVSQIRQEAFTARFDTVLTFRHRSRVSTGYPTVLCGGEGVYGFQMLHEGIVSALRGAGLKLRSAALTPHLTLLYDKQKIDTEVVDPIEWDVREFVLLLRHIGQRRPYSVLGKWPLHESRPRNGASFH
jgi:2'-5' RNA ligase